ncbi:MAG: ABC transporter ATP-binding protein [Campylobacteraceae bacterium]|nr:ABC transporter ATP-binding protein [Campylobacteraceae bacterium]
MQLEVKNLSFYYEKEKFCFKDLSFELKSNETLAILGLNGQGKSTLLYNLIGVLKPVSGKAKIYGDFSFLSQAFFLVFDYSVLDIVLMGFAKQISVFKTPSKAHKIKAIEALELLGVAHLKDRNFNTLSGGQKQLVLFARAIVAKNKILFLDEPLSAMDLKNQDKVLSLISRLQKELGLSVVFTTHQPNHALALADKTLILYDDLSYKFGKTKDILTDEFLEKLYKVPIKNLNFTHESLNLNALVPIYSLYL